MPFVKGQSGNPAGSMKKYRIRAKVSEILETLNFDPFIEAVKLFRETKKDQIKCDILIDLCNYIAPKLKHIEVSSDNENPFVLNLNISPRKNKEDKQKAIIEVKKEK